MGQIDPNELGRRLRAARGYAGINQPALAKGVGLSHSTVKRLEAGGGTDELKAETLIARAATTCGLPVEFFTVDFARLTEATADDVEDLVQDRLAQLLGGIMRHLREQAAAEGDPEKAAVAEALSTIDAADQAEAERAEGAHSPSTTATKSEGA